VAEQPDKEILQERLLKVMRAHPKFGKVERRMFGRQALMVSPDYQINNFIKVARDLGPAGAMRWLHKVYDTRSANILAFAEVHGVNIKQAWSFANDVRLITLDALPDSERGRNTKALYQLSFPEGLMRFGLPPAFAVHESRDVLASLALPDTDSPIPRPIGRAVRALVVLSDNAAPVLGESWTAFADPDLEKAQFGRATAMSRFDGPNESLRLSVELDDAACAKVNNILKLEEHVAALLDIVADRLILARRRVGVGNRAIDASICLEALFGDRNSQSELTSRISLRAALFVSGDLGERQAVRKRVKALYSLRSKAVHAAKLVWSPDDREIATDGIKLVGRLLNRLVELRELPDWEIWELSGGEPKES
jgi:hypothetical protein